MNQHTPRQNRDLKKYFEFTKKTLISYNRSRKKHKQKQKEYKRLVVEHGLNVKNLNNQQSESKWNINRRICKIEKIIDFHGTQLNDSINLTCKLVLKLVKKFKRVEDVVYNFLQNRFQMEGAKEVDGIDSDWHRCISFTIMVVMLGLSWRAVGLICEKVCVCVCVSVCVCT